MKARCVPADGGFEVGARHGTAPATCGQALKNMRSLSVAGTAEHSGIAGRVFPLPVRPGGFTLLEVMISLAIVGALLVTVIGTLNYHLALAERQTAVMLTTTLAQQKLSEMRRSPTDSSGNFEGDRSDLAYRTTVIEAAFPGMLELSVTVTGRGETASLSELIVKPR